MAWSAIDSMRTIGHIHRFIAPSRNENSIADFSKWKKVREGKQTKGKGTIELLVDLDNNIQVS